MKLLKQLEIAEACMAWAWIEVVDDPLLRSKIVRMVVRSVMSLQWKDVQDSNMKQEVKDALVEFQNKVEEIQLDFLLAKYNLWNNE